MEILNLMKEDAIVTGSCPKCGKPLTNYYSGTGGRSYIGCSDFSTCCYKEEINPKVNKNEVS